MNEFKFQGKFLGIVERQNLSWGLMVKAIIDTSYNDRSNKLIERHVALNLYRENAQLAMTLQPGTDVIGDATIKANKIDKKDGSGSFYAINVNVKTFNPNMAQMQQIPNGYQQQYNAPPQQYVPVQSPAQYQPPQPMQSAPPPQPEQYPSLDEIPF